MNSKIYDDLDTHDYQDFLSKLINANYNFIFFKELKDKKGQLILRHDIDFDCKLAHESALIEKKLGVKASYFFMISSESYNIRSAENFRLISEIKEMGHTISIHFDPVIYKDFEKGLEQEVNYFSNLFEVDIDIISLHRPNLFFQDFNQTIFGIKHTYQQKYFKDIKYFADSTGIWRFGHPFNSQEFLNNESLHVLIHPIWWTIEGNDSADKIKKHYFSRIAEIKEHYRNNCKTFGQIYDSI